MNRHRHVGMVVGGIGERLAGCDGREAPEAPHPPRIAYFALFPLCFFLALQHLHRPWSIDHARLPAVSPGRDACTFRWHRHALASRRILERAPRRGRPRPRARGEAGSIRPTTPVESRPAVYGRRDSAIFIRRERSRYERREAARCSWRHLRGRLRRRQRSARPCADQRRP